MNYISDRNSEIDVKITKSYDVVLPQISKCIQMSIKRDYFLPELNVLLSFRSSLIWLRLECSGSQFGSISFEQGKFLQHAAADTFPTWFTGCWFSSVESVLWRNVRINQNDLDFCVCPDLGEVTLEKRDGYAYNMPTIYANEKLYH